jgi:hypothetical protein
MDVQEADQPPVEVPYVTISVADADANVPPPVADHEGQDLVPHAQEVALPPEVAELILRRNERDNADRSPSSRDGSLRFELAATPKLDSWGLGLAIYELFSSGGAPLFPFATDASHLEALADGTVDTYLGAVSPPAARHVLEKLLEIEPERRASLDDVIKHAWFGGGLDTIELQDSFAGLQQAQELTQRQLATMQAELRGKKMAAKEAAQSAAHLEEEQYKRREAAASKRRAVLSAGIGAP